ncbi:M48 family metalloprotease [Pontibacter cellulosilyticus]|uniref:Membrane-binding protein n=1 Tax=Pontibacter cellulosilyticus TaxID=1720253 RepID=A0A923N9T1_9BACT|nr:membrane-binding protein [Pontibacter cellulosilyticus]MBC5994319.1 membrane-binding protein [Pontibacter cellulosilyticus]
MIYFKKLTVALGLVLASVLGAEATAATVAAPDLAVAPAAAGTRDIVQEIINVIGLKPRFELMPADIDNAAAVVYNGKRYILYNERFLDAINNAVHTDWGGVSIIAHEIGHHLNGHTLTRSGSNPGDELEADEFSGFVLRKMGASLAEAQAAINLLSDERTSRTHPGRNYRLEAISKGWRSANEQLIASAKSPQPDQRAIARTQPTQRQLQQIQGEQRTSQNSSLDSRYVLSRVHFSKAPREEFYITTKLQLVHVTDNGIKIIGKLAKTNNPEFPYYFESDVLQPVYVTERGVLVNRQGHKVGYLA